MGDAQEHFGSANAKQQQIKHFTEHVRTSETIAFKNICDISKNINVYKNAINTDLKNMSAHLYEIFCFLSLHKINSDYVIFH